MISLAIGLFFPQVRNSEYPERSIRTRSGVTSLDFSERHPNLLAVGMYDGTIAIYDIARKAEVRRALLARYITIPWTRQTPRFVVVETAHLLGGVARLSCFLCRTGGNAGSHTLTLCEKKYIHICIYFVQHVMRS